jgi:signal transduction histidine kinase
MLSGLTRELPQAGSPFATVATALTLLQSSFGGIVAAWLDRSGTAADLRLVGVLGASGSEGAHVSEAMPVIPRRESLSPARREDLQQRFARAVGTSETGVIDGGRALMLVAAPSTELADLSEAAGEVMRSALDQAPSGQGPGESGTLGLAWAAHELSSPLREARMAISAIHASEHLSARERRLLAGTDRSLEDLGARLQAILDLASDRASLEREAVDILDLVGRIVAGSKIDSARRVSIAASERPVTVVGDPIHLRSAIGNVIENALVHSPPGAAVQVAVGSTGNDVVIEVIDQGPGIPVADRELIFEPFVRGGDRSKPGSGLGLFVTRRVVELHGGTIQVISRPIGSTFRIEIPKEDFPA